MDSRRAAWTTFAPIFVGAVAAGTLHPEWVRAEQAALISVAFMMFLFSPLWERKGSPVRLGGALGMLGVAMEPLAKGGFIGWALGLQLESLVLIPLLTLLMLEFVQPPTRVLEGPPPTRARRAADVILMAGTYLFLSALAVFVLGAELGATAGEFLAQSGLAMLGIGAALIWAPRAAKARPHTTVIDSSLQATSPPKSADAK